MKQILFLSLLLFSLASCEQKASYSNRMVEDVKFLASDELDWDDTDIPEDMEVSSGSSDSVIDHIN